MMAFARPIKERLLTVLTQVNNARVFSKNNSRMCVKAHPSIEKQKRHSVVLQSVFFITIIYVKRQTEFLPK